MANDHNPLELSDFIEARKRFEEYYCRQMYEGGDFTLKIEVRGSRHKMLHCKVDNQEFFNRGPQKTNGKSAG